MEPPSEPLQLSPAVRAFVEAQRVARLAWAMLRCHAEVLGEGDEGYAQAIEALRAKYPQYREMDLDGRPLVALTPVRAGSWGVEDRTT